MKASYIIHRAHDHVNNHNGLHLQYKKDEFEKIRHQTTMHLMVGHFKGERLETKRLRSESNSQKGDKKFNKRQKISEISHSSVVTGAVRITKLTLADHINDINTEMESRGLPQLYANTYPDEKKRGKEMSISDKKNAIMDDERKRRQTDPKFDPKEFFPVSSAQFKIKLKS